MDANAGGSGDEPELLRKAVTSALQAAVDQKLPILALPLISSGNFGCPVEKAAELAVAAVFDFLQQMDAGLQQCLQVRLCLSCLHLWYNTLQSYALPHMHVLTVFELPAFVVQHSKNICIATHACTNCV